VVAVGNGLAASLAALVALLAALGTTVGLSVLACGVGLTCGVVMCAAVARGLGEGDATVLGSADLVTLVRATLTCGVAAMVADSFLRQPAAPALVALAVASLTLDAVDGPVARHTRTASVFGARFDGEADAFLILVLSVYVARSVGAWVLLIGGARYAFAVAGWVLPCLHAQHLPPRYWRKVVAAVQGIVLVFAAADVAPHASTYVALCVALLLLTESFGRDVLWLWGHRSAGAAELTGPTGDLHLRLP